MHPSFEKAAGLTEMIIAAAIEVHRDKGPGLIESIYEWCLLKELGLRGLECASQKSIPIQYKGYTRDEPLPLRCPRRRVRPRGSQGRRKGPSNP